MNRAEAIKICEGWFSHLERKKQDCATMQKAAIMARSGDTEGARRLKSSVDNAPRVYDGATLLPAVEFLVKLAKGATDNAA